MTNSCKFWQILTNSYKFLLYLTISCNFLQILMNSDQFLKTFTNSLYLLQILINPYKFHINFLDLFTNFGSMIQNTLLLQLTLHIFIFCLKFLTPTKQKITTSTFSWQVISTTNFSILFLPHEWICISPKRVCQSFL